MKRLLPAVSLTTVVCICSVVGWAQGQPPYPQQAPYPQQGNQAQGNQAPAFAPQELDQLVAPYALYPDPLLAQVLTAATFSGEIPDADGWARSHAYLTGDALARAITEDNLPWDPSVIALLPTPSVLDVMAGNMAGTEDLGDAVLANRTAVMDAIQDQRQKAYNYGYLRSNQQDRVVAGGPGDLEILPVNPTAIYVPYYDPNIVFFRPAPGYFAGGAITFGPGIYINAFFPWGWGGVSFGWRTHTIMIGGRPWERTWLNRGAYFHPYAAPARPRAVNPGARMERHELREYRPTPRGGERR